jgi:hypothetical protein
VGGSGVSVLAAEVAVGAGSVGSPRACVTGNVTALLVAGAEGDSHAERTSKMTIRNVIVWYLCMRMLPLKSY